MNSIMIIINQQKGETMNNSPNNPWIALGSYEEKDAYRFYGREKDTANLLNMLEQNKYVVCYAASGDGKSSLINAGLCPAFRENGFFPIKISCTTDEYNGVDIYRNNDGSIDFDAFFLKKIEDNISEQEKRYKKDDWNDNDNRIIFEKIKGFENYNFDKKLWWKLRTETIQIPFGEYNYTPVLIFDQFEEFFNAKWTKEFFFWLEELSNDKCPQELLKKVIDAGYSVEKLPGEKKFHALFSMRFEYAGELDYYCQQLTYTPELSRNRYFLKPFTKEQAISVIKSQKSDEVSDKLKECADTIVNHVLNEKNPNEVSSIMLSIVCHELYEKWANKEEKVNDIENIDLKNIIYDYYNNKLSDIGLSKKSRRLLESAMLEGKTRIKIPIVRKEGYLIYNNRKIFEEEKLSELVSTHLIKKTDNGDVSYIELIHDRLAEVIYEKNEEIKTGKQEKGISIFIWSLLSVILILLCSLVVYFFFLKDDRVVSNESFNFSVKIDESNEIADKIAWRAQLTIIAYTSGGEDTLIHEIINDLSIDTTYSFTRDSLKKVACVLCFAKNVKEEFRNIDTVINITSLKSNPNINLQINRNISKYYDFSGKVCTRYGNRDYAIQNAVIIVRDYIQRTDDDGMFCFKLLDTLSNDESIYVVKDGYKVYETSLNNNFRDQQLYRIESVDSFMTFEKECNKIDSLLINTPNPQNVWKYGFSTYYDNSPYPAIFGNGEEDEIVIIARNKNEKANKRRDKSARIEIYGVYYFKKEYERSKDKYLSYHIFTGYIDNGSFQETPVMKFDIESRDIFGNKQFIRGGNYYKEDGKYRLSGEIKNQTGTVATFKHI